MELRKLRDKAAETFSKGRFAKAAELYEDYCERDPKDIQARLRMGDAWSKAGVRQKAISAYKSAAQAFASEGFLPRAIAASKLILELDPAHQGVQQMLADLYARRGTPARSSRGPSTLSTPPVAVAVASADAGSVAPEVVPLVTRTVEPLELPAQELELGAARMSNEVAAGGNSAVVPQGATELPPELELFEPPQPPGLRRADASPLPLEERQGEGALAAAPDEAASAQEAMIVTIELQEPPAPASQPLAAAVPAPPAGSRIWMPGAAPEGTASPALPPSPPPFSPAPLVADRAPSSDITRALSVFDELSLDAPLRPPLPPEPPPHAGEAPKPRLPSFTELELEGDSLLHAVEVAALAGQELRGEVVAEVGEGAEDEEEVFSITTGDEPADRDAGQLPQIPLFSDLPPDAFIELFDRCPLRRFDEGEQVIAQGSVGDAFYVVCEGSVRVVREHEQGSSELAVLADGAFFGEMALLSGSPRFASVFSASADTQLLEISAPVLAQLSHRYPPVAQALKKFCRQRLLSNVMASSALFRPFSRQDRRALITKFRSREAQRGAVLIREGGETDGLYVLLSGEVQVTRAGHELARLREGEIFGEMSLLRKTPASATVTTSRRCSLLRLPRADFDALVLSHPQILMLVAELTDDRQRRTERVLAQTAPLGSEVAVLV